VRETEKGKKEDLLWMLFVERNTVVYFEKSSHLKTSCATFEIVFFSSLAILCVAESGCTFFELPSESSSSSALKAVGKGGKKKKKERDFMSFHACQNDNHLIFLLFFLFLL